MLSNRKGRKEGAEFAVGGALRALRLPAAGRPLREIKREVLYLRDEGTQFFLSVSSG